MHWILIYPSLWKIWALFLYGGIEKNLRHKCVIVFACQGFGNPISIELHDLTTGDSTNTNIAKLLAQQGHAIYKRKNDNDGSESLDTLSEGARSLCSNDVEIEEEEDVIDADSSILEFKESELDVSTSSKSSAVKEDLLEKVLSAKSSFSPAIPLLSPNEFTVSKSSTVQQDKKDDVNVSKETKLVSKETESSNEDSTKLEVKSDNAHPDSEVD